MSFMIEGQDFWLRLDSQQKLYHVSPNMSALILNFNLGFELQLLAMNF